MLGYTREPSAIPNYRWVSKYIPLTSCRSESSCYLNLARRLYTRRIKSCIGISERKM